MRHKHSGTPKKFNPGDRVAIVRPERRGDKLDRATTRGHGVVLEVYPTFVVVQMRHFRECFRYDEVKKIGSVRKEAV